MKPKHIYIIIEVSYTCDYYTRIQKNLAAAYTPADARRLAEQHGGRVVESEEESDAMGDQATDHIWVQEMLVSVKP